MQRRLLVPLAFALVLVGATPAAARQATPGAGSDDPIAAVRREFRAPGPAGGGTLALIGIANVFRTANAADRAFPAMLEAIVHELTSEGADVTASSDPVLGDESAAFGGTIALDGRDGFAVTGGAGLVGFRRGEVVVIVLAFGLGGRSMPDAIAAAKSVAARGEFTATPSTGAPNAPRTGGAFAHLPTTEDVPAGMEMTAEDVIWPR